MRRGSITSDQLAWMLLIAMLLLVVVGIAGRGSCWYVPDPRPYEAHRLSARRR